MDISYVIEELERSYIKDEDIRNKIIEIAEGLGGVSGVKYVEIKNALHRLMCDKPISSIKNIEGEWAVIDTYNVNGPSIRNPCAMYRNKYLSSLFKWVYLNGDEEFLDVDRFVFSDGKVPNPYPSLFITRLLNNKFPIKFPYFPSTSPTYVHIERFTSAEAVSPFDTLGVICMLFDNRFYTEINLFYKLDFCNWKEISHDEYAKRKKTAR